MKSILLTLFNLLLILIFNQNVCNTQSQTVHQIQIDKLTNEYFEIEKELWKKIDTQQILIDRGNLLNEVYRIHNRSVNNEFGDANLIWNLEIKKNERFISKTVAIDTNYKNIRHYLTNAEYPKLVDLSTSAVDEMEKTLEDFFEAINDRQFWNDILSNRANGQCNRFDQSSSSVAQEGNEFIFNLYKEISAVALKSYISIQLSYIILKITENEAAKHWRPNDLRQSFRERYIWNQENVKRVLMKASQKRWMCDKNFIPAKYYQITRFIQGYIDNEINLNADESCRQTCSDYKKTVNFACKDATLCAEKHIDQAITKCNGTVYDCDTDEDDLTLCPSSLKLATRRYDYIRYSNGKTLGKYNGCLQSAKIASWTSWFVKCSNCFCYCDEQSELSDRFFSLHDTVSNIKENRIVTGVSIIKRNRLIQFMIAESTLLPFGKLNTTIVNDGDDLNVVPTNNRYVSHPEWTIDTAGIKNGVDYHTLTYEHRTINLDTVVAPAGKLVTGVRFHVLEDKSLSIQIRATDFDYEQGRLKNLEKSIWISSDAKKRKELLLNESDIPTRAYQPLEANWAPNQYIKFGPSDRTKDVGQTTVPFMDGTFVEGNPTLLSGIGFYYKGQPKFGGFIAPFLLTFDFGSLIQPI